MQHKPGRKAKPRTPGIRPAIVYGAFALLCGTNALTLVGLMMSPDIASLMSGRSDEVLSAYEDRVAQLRVEVDRLHSRQYAQAGDLNLQLQELAQQQDMLTEQHRYIREIASRAVDLGIDTAAMPALDIEAAPLVTGSLGPAPRRAAPAMTSPAADDLAAHSANLQAMMAESRGTLSAISTAAAESADDILEALNAIGISPALPDAADGVGGPFIPAEDAPGAGGMAEEAEAALDALLRFEAARSAIDAAPIHMPVANGRTSSNFGTRKDPFSGRRAFHAGIDFPRPTGTTVISAGAGRVSFAGVRSGYGKTVEVTHTDGLVTRYAHLSAFLVTKGAQVEAGTPIARVGSTGRSTGPHLHFEVRRKDAPLNPGAFLEAGKRLSRFMSSV